MHVDLYGSDAREKGYGSREYGIEEGGVDRITVYYVKNQVRFVIIESLKMLIHADQITTSN